MPRTNENRWSFLLRATRPPPYPPPHAGEGREGAAASIVLPTARDPNRFDAVSISGVGIFPCIGGRGAQAAKRFEDAVLGMRPGCLLIEIATVGLSSGD